MNSQRTRSARTESFSSNSSEPRTGADAPEASGLRSSPFAAGIVAAACFAISGCGAAGPYIVRGQALSPDDIRSATAVVREVPHKDVQALFDELAQDARSADDLDENVRGLLMARAKSQGHGSGFVVVRASAENPAPFIITNHHVVEYASTVEVSFDDEARLSGCNVVYDDRRMDLAVVSCEGKSSHLSWGLDLATDDPHDLDSVVAAGFPALGGEPAYQSTQGKISNSRYKDENKRLLFQHTAPIDPGSSGGPLLNERGQLVGVNTLKARERDSVYLAVPAHDVKTILDKAIATQKSFATPETKKAALVAACRGFADEVASNDANAEALSDFISNELIAKDGWRSFNMMVEALPAVSQRLGAMFLLDPIGAMRFAILQRLSFEIEGAGGAFECDAINENDAEMLERDSGVRVKFRVGGDKHEGKWVVEHGHWKLASFQF